MQQTIAGAFRQLPGSSPPITVSDTAILVAAPQWTGGATLVDELTISPPAGQSWTVQSFSISFAGALFTRSPAFGALGKLIAAVMVGASPTPQGYVNPMLPLPTNISNALTLWDGQQDPPFPQLAIPAVPTFENVPTIGGGNLAQPIGVGPGEKIAIGLWLTPSLTQNTIIQILNAQYTVLYDDGRPTGMNAR